MQWQRILVNHRLSFCVVINRILIDNCSNLLFCIEPRSVSLLQNEGINNSNLVGNTAIDSLHIVKKNINKKNLITNKEFYLATLHRPFNVDNQHTLNQILHQLNKFDKPIKKEEAPPFPSAPTYDAKAWPFIKQYAKPRALFWNVGA